ncbi:MAG: hypothetical protein WC528_03675 [Patescibacteria group bacterium]
MKKALSALAVCLVWAGMGVLLLWMGASSSVGISGEALGFLVFLSLLLGALGVLISGLWALIELFIIIGSAVTSHRARRTATPSV